MASTGRKLGIDFASAVPETEIGNSIFLPPTERATSPMHHLNGEKAARESLIAESLGAHEIPREGDFGADVVTVHFFLVVVF